MLEGAIRSATVSSTKNTSAVSWMLFQVKNGSEKELCRLYDAVIQHYRALKATKSNSFNTVLTMILQQKLDEKTRLKERYDRPRLVEEEHFRTTWMLFQ